MILVTNDDGIGAAGLRALVEIATWHDDEVVVVAPAGPQSGSSHSFSVATGLACEERPGMFFPRHWPSVRSYAVRGTPVDCVKLGVFGLCGKRPDLVLSGINHGSNTSISVHYSGTVAAAREGALIGIRSLALSLDDTREEANYSEAQDVADFLISEAQSGAMPGLLYNVNIPRGHVDEIERHALLAPGRWIEEPLKQTTPYGQDLYWLMGHFESDAPDDERTDEWLIHHHRVAVTPLLLDVMDPAQQYR